MTPKVLLSAAGTWHAPHLAYQLQLRGMLGKVVTTMPPARYTMRAPIDRNLIDWWPAPELIGERMARKLRLPRPLLTQASIFHDEMFDWMVARKIERYHIDLLVAFAGFGLHTILRCNSLGLPSVVERGSAHAQYRELLLAEEYDRLGLTLRQNALSRRQLDRQIAEYDAAKFIAIPSTFVKSSFVASGVPEEKLIQLPYGVDLNRFYPTVGSPKNHFQVLCVGNLGVEKGIGYLIDAIALTGDRSIELVLIGSLDDYANTKLRSSNIRWRFLGRVAQVDLPRHYQSATVFCLLSIQEGMSMALMEALASGLPVIASTNTGALDLITDGVEGHIVPIRNAEAVAEVLVGLRENRDVAQQMGVKARQRMMSHSWDDYGAQVSAAYLRRITDAISAAR